MAREGDGAGKRDSQTKYSFDPKCRILLNVTRIAHLTLRYIDLYGSIVQCI